VIGLYSLILIALGIMHHLAFDHSSNTIHIASWKP
jgi:hypothetical protein